jgi:gamma-glutamyltranspeptidase/glutathione hydrolase
MTKHRWLPLALVGSLLGAGLSTSVPSIGAEAAPGAEGAKPEPARKPYGIATESPGATREASRVLEAGGNAFDAAVVAALVAGFTNPSSSGIGGGGFALVWSARDQKASVLDFRETAPAGIDVTALDKRPVPLERRGQTVGVPGEVAGLYELHGRFGKLPWKDVVTRASRLAELGFVAEPHTTSQVAEQAQGPLAKSGTFRNVYLPGGKPLTLGQKLRAAKLAKTLNRIAAQGKRGFYEGPVAADLVQAAASAGGALSLADLASYQTVAREPLQIDWNGKRVLTMPLPSAGGMLIAQMLGLFTEEELRGLSSAPGKRIHLLAEGMRASFADRARFMGDPAFVKVDVTKLLSPVRLAKRKARLAEDRTHTQPRFGLEEAGTHHLVTADAEGNWVSLTTTVNDAFGARLVAEQSGVLLNNELTDFSSPDSVAPFGSSENPNRVRPGARPVSSMSPTLVLEGGVPNQALGGSGGITIGPNVAQVLLNRLVSGMSVTDAVAAPRFTIPPPRSGLTLILESALGKAHAADLEARGELSAARDWKNAVQLVAREGGTFHAAADPRKGGSAAVQ